MVDSSSRVVFRFKAHNMFEGFGDQTTRSTGNTKEEQGGIAVISRGSEREDQPKILSLLVR
jgi:hypothetical protein